MKCKLCGYEVEPGVVKCPNCGSRVGLSDNAAAFSDGEMSWNTRDFPKPKKMSDIEMSWPDIRSHTVSISED